MQNCLRFKFEKTSFLQGKVILFKNSASSRYIHPKFRQKSLGMDHLSSLKLTAPQELPEEREWKPQEISELPSEVFKLVLKSNYIYNML